MNQTNTIPRSMGILSKSVITLLVIGSTMTPMTSMAASSSTLSLHHPSHIAVNNQILSNPNSLFHILDPSSHKETSFMPIWYVFRLLKPYGLSYQWDSSQHCLYITTDGISTAPNTIDHSANSVNKGQLKVYLNGKFVQTMEQYVLIDPESQHKTLYVSIWYMDKVLALAHVNASWNGNKGIWNLTVGAQGGGAATAMVTTISHPIANSPFIVYVNPIELDGKPLGPGHVVKVTVSDRASTCSMECFAEPL